MTDKIQSTAPAQSVGVPDGWKLVPLIPTEAMIEVGCDNNPTQWNEGTDHGFPADVASDIYVSMVRAAQPPAAPVETDDITEALNARQEAINESMARPRSSAVIDDDELTGWARSWHWNDCLDDKPVDPSIYFRDMRMLKAFIEYQGRAIPTEPQALPVQLTGELACILEDCGPPEKQTPGAVENLIHHYQPTWDRIRSALSRPQSK